MTAGERDEPWTIRRVLDWAGNDLKDRGSETPRLDAELLLGMVLKTDRIRLIIDASRPLSKDELKAYRTLHTRRRAGEPIAYLRGEREFYGRPFRVDSRVLIPRPDTEVVVEAALRRTAGISLSARVLDIGTGSGCIAITLAKERPTNRIIGVDISPGALSVARDNAIRLGAFPAVGFLESDLLSAVHDWRFDLVISNPPYISEADMAEVAVDIRNFEPHLALTPGREGFEIIDRIIAEAPVVLSPAGVLVLEVGFGQAARVADRLGEAGYRDIRVDRDLGGVERAVSGIRPTV